jgi:hypothetical protein
VFEVIDLGNGCIPKIRVIFEGDEVFPITNQQPKTIMLDIGNLSANLGSVCANH